MKSQFIFNGRKYIAPSKKEADNFLAFWDSFFSRVRPFNTNWKIKHIERAPCWVPVSIMEEDNKVEYS